MDTVVQFLIEWGYGGLFLSAFLAGTILPFSSELILMSCIGLGLDPLWATLWTTAGNATGGLTCYWIGHLGKMEWIEKYLGVNEKAMEKATRMVHGKGASIAILSFLPVVGDAILVVLGLMKANVWVTGISMTIGKLGRYTIIVATTLGLLG